MSQLNYLQCDYYLRRALAQADLGPIQHSIQIWVENAS